MGRMRSSKRTMLTVAVLLLASVATGASAQEGDPPADDGVVSVSGTVTDTLTAAPVAEVLVMGFRVTPGVGAQPIGSTRTAADGTYALQFRDIPDALGVVDRAYENEYRYPELAGAGPFVVDMDIHPRTDEPAVEGQAIDAATGEVIRQGKLDAFLHYTSYVDGTRPFLPFSVGYDAADWRPADPTISFDFYRVQPGQEFYVEVWVASYADADGESRSLRSETFVYDGSTPVEIRLEFTPRFTDVDAVAVFDEATDLEVAIGWMGDVGLTTGYADGSFRPWTEVTRQALAAFLYRLAGSPEQEPADSFEDVDVDHRFSREIAWLADSGLTTGWDDGTFRPTQPVSRQALAAMLYRYAEGEAPTAGTDFADVDEEHRFAAEIAWLESAEITTGYDDGTFRPTATLRRGPTAQFLYRLDQYLWGEES